MLNTGSVIVIFVDWTAALDLWSCYLGHCWCVPQSSLWSLSVRTRTCLMLPVSLEYFIYLILSSLRLMLMQAITFWSWIVHNWLFIFMKYESKSQFVHGNKMFVNFRLLQTNFYWHARKFWVFRIISWLQLVLKYI